MKSFILWIIRFYQKHISVHTTPCCRFSPTCSQYGLEAVERFGALKGGAMTVWRILRCNPWGAGGYDPVPENKLKTKKRKYKFIEYKAIKNKEKE